MNESCQRIPNCDALCVHDTRCVMCASLVRLLPHARSAGAGAGAQVRAHRRTGARVRGTCGGARMRTVRARARVRAQRCVCVCACARRIFYLVKSGWGMRNLEALGLRHLLY